MMSSGISFIRCERRAARSGVVSVSDMKNSGIPSKGVGHSPIYIDHLKNRDIRRL
jgi:hypothetical protein